MLESWTDENRPSEADAIQLETLAYDHFKPPELDQKATKYD